MKALITLLLLLAATAGTVVVLTRSPRRQVFAMGVNGLVLSVLFETLQAPDVALAEIVVGAAVLPLMFFVILASARMDRASRAAGTAREESRSL